MSYLKARLHPLVHTALVAASVATATLLSGCGLVTNVGAGLLPGSGTVPVSSPGTSAGQILGHVHGGQQPVSYATVRLYAAGYTGYGSASTLLATTTTSGDGAGTFSFTKVASGGGNGTTSTYNCPASGDPQLYLISSGGNTKDTTTGAHTTNPAATMLAPLGVCSGITSSTQVGISEISTAAAITALSSYFNPNTESIGTSATTQGTVGLNNAVASIANLANNFGQTVFPPTYTGSNTSVAGITVTATAEMTKLITIADILAACINSTNVDNAASTQCSELLGAATPPAPAVTSQPSLTFSAATDTLQAAYFMATNPTDSGAIASACSANGETISNLHCLLTLPTGISPFQPFLTSTSDWTIGVTYAASGACAGGGSFISGPVKTSIDASGNVWFLSGAATNANLSEMSPSGKPLFCGGNGASGRGLTIDPTGNVWVSFNGNDTSTSVQELPTGSSTLVNWPVTTTTASLASDGLGNIYYGSNINGGLIFQFAAPGATVTPFAPGFYAGPLRTVTTSTTVLNTLSIDPINRPWVNGTTVTSIFTIYPTPAAATYNITNFSTTTPSSGTATITFTSPNPPAASGGTVTVAGLTSAAATTLGLNGMHLLISSRTSTTFKATILDSQGAATAATPDTGTASLNTGSVTVSTPTDNSYGLAIDSANYVYTGTTCCGTTQTTYKLAEKITPNAANGVAATTANSTPYLGGINGVRSTALDGAANTWYGMEFSSVGDQTATTNYPIAEIATSGPSTFTALSPTGATLNSNSANGTITCSTGVGCPTGGGFIKNDVQQVLDLAVDPSGSVWVMNTSTAAANYVGTSIVQIVGAAVPAATPLSSAIAAGKLATKP